MTGRDDLQKVIFAYLDAAGLRGRHEKYAPVPKRRP